MKEYPQWKIVAWRFLRTAVAGGFSTLVSISIVLKPDLSNIKAYGLALLSAFIAGAVAAIGLSARELWGNAKQTSVIDKIII